MCCNGFWTTVELCSKEIYWVLEVQVTLVSRINALLVLVFSCNLFIVKKKYMTFFKQLLITGFSVSSV